MVSHLRARTIPSPRTIQILESLNKFDPSTVVIQLNLKVIQFNNYLDAILERVDQAEPENQAVGLYDLMILGERIDAQAHAWPGGHESAFIYQPAKLSLSEWSGPFDIYETLGITHDWNMVRCARISLWLSIVKCSRTLLTTGYMSVEAESAFEKAQSIIATLLEDIVASFPFCLGMGDAKCNLPVAGIGTSGFALLWPIGVLLKCPFATPKQIASALQMIDYIGGALGLQRAVFLKQAWTGGVFS